MGKIPDIFIAIPAALFALVLSFLFPSAGIVSLFLYALFSFVYIRVDKSDRRFVLSVLALGFVLRLAAMFTYYKFWLLAGRQDVIGPDGESFSRIGWYIRTILRGDANALVPSGEFIFRNFREITLSYKGHVSLTVLGTSAPFLHLVGFAYYLLGYAPLLIKSFNVIISLFSSVIVYLTALEISTRRAARISFVIFLFFPSIFLFSVTMLKEPIIILCVLLIIYSLVRLKEGTNVKKVFITAASLIVILFLREEFFVVMSLVAAVFLTIRMRGRWKLSIIVISLAVMAAAASGVFPKINLKSAVFKDTAASFFIRQASQYYGGGRLAYRVFPERYYEDYRKFPGDSEYLASAVKITTGKFIRYLPKGVFFYLARPFPFLRHDVIYTLISFQMLYWYVIVLMALPGAFRVRMARALPIFFYLLIVIAATAMVEGNEGILLRHRDSVVPFFIIFASSLIGKTRKTS